MCVACVCSGGSAVWLASAEMGRQQLRWPPQRRGSSSVSGRAAAAWLAFAGMGNSNSSSVSCRAAAASCSPTTRLAPATSAATQGHHGQRWTLTCIPVFSWDGRRRWHVATCSIAHSIWQRTARSRKENCHHNRAQNGSIPVPQMCALRLTPAASAASGLDAGSATYVGSVAGLTRRKHAPFCPTSQQEGREL